MAKTILVPVDGSPQSYAALEHAIAEFPEAEITLLNVIDPVESGYNAPVATPAQSEQWYESATEEAEQVFETARERAGDAGPKLKTEIEVGRPSRVIVEYAGEHEFDSIVMGSHGRDGMSRILLGSVAETVVRRATMPVTVVR